jgi:hypothetical protein
MADGKVKVHDRIRYKNPNLGMETVYGNGPITLSKRPPAA